MLVLVRLGCKFSTCEKANFALVLVQDLKVG